MDDMAAYYNTYLGLNRTRPSTYTHPLCQYVHKVYSECEFESQSESECRDEWLTTFVNSSLIPLGRENRRRRGF